MTDEYIEDTMDRKETVWEAGTKPEFKDGRQLVEWLGRRLSYLEPFAPQDAVHYCFHREWSRDKFQPKLDLLVEDDNEEKSEEEGYEEIAEEKAREHIRKEETVEHNSKEESIGETTKEEDIGEDNDGGMGETAEGKAMEEVAEEKGMEEAANEESIEEKGIEDVTQEEGMEETAEERGMKDVTKEEGKEGTSRGAEMTAQNSHMEEENGDLIHSYIRMMTSPLILDGFLATSREIKTFNISRESKEFDDEMETMSNFWSADEKRKKSKICKLWSRLNPFNHKNKNETEKNHEKKERRVKNSFFFDSSGEIGAVYNTKST